MPQINLLGQENTHRNAALTRLPLYLVRFFVVLFIAVLLYWVYLYVRVKLVVNKVAVAQADIIRIQKETLADKDRRELLVRQGQLSTLDKLLKDQQYWSKFLPELARVTLKSASYLSFSAGKDGTARMSVTVPTYREFDEFLQVFDLPQFNSKFSNVTVSSIGKYQQGDTQSVRFDVTMQYDVNFLKASDNSSSPTAQ
ncbi:MAG: hypothetical protein JNK33_02110 [Candidatus Doudnabacteria bacterium]|nr:hypothetical protein [Candidatus Doudnabacteria bacterium]